MSDNIKDVKKAFESAEDIAPDENLEAPEDATEPPRTPPDGPPPAPPVDDPHDPFMRAAAQPLNDYGNGQRFVIHFGRDLMFVPRVGWHVWSGKVWEFDPPLNSKNGITSGGIAVRAKAQKIWALIEKETDYIQPTKRERKLLEEKRRLRDRETELEGLQDCDRAEGHDAELSTLRMRMKTIEGIVKTHETMIGRRLTHAKNAGNNGPIGHMMTESTTDLAVPFEDLDAHPLEINTKSGLLRFSVVDARNEGGGKTADCRLLDHQRDQKLTKIMPVTYDSRAEAPLFHSFLERIQPDREMREFLKRWHGLSMTGLKIQKLAFYFGSGANGKSVLVDLMCRIMAGYAASLKIESLTGSNRRSGAEATPDLIPLLGARLVRASEAEQGEKLQEALIKQLTGGEPIPVRPNYGDQINMDAIFKLTLSGNYKPEIRGTDDGIWRRVMLVPFDVQIPENERDEQFGEKLWAERDGIFNWMCEGLLDYLEGGLAPPEQILSATKEYREESDPISNFLTTCCTITGNHSDAILSKELGDAFNYYLLERGYTTWKPTTFAKQIAMKSRQWKHPETRKQFDKGKSSLSQYTGLKLTDAFHRRFKDAPKDQNGRPIGVSASNTSSSPHPFEDDFRE
ncbi:MAG: hypothetical protein GXP05_04470 [Alphaproteobacteria bacterium]|nr:hypothetical protein [Alphaproteobacteria bacterium]